jgi:chloramphenicol 3-O phosphotransferase
LFSAMHHAILAAARCGMNVIADHVLVEEKWLRECTELFHDMPAWLVGVRCPLNVLEQREKSRENRTPGQARLQYERVHVPGIYDIEVDTSIKSPQECASAVFQQVMAGKTPGAFQRICQLHRHSINW